MALHIVIVGDVPERPDRTAVLATLGAAYPEATWEWYQAEGLQFQIPPKLLNKLLHELRQDAVKCAANQGERKRVVKLADLNGRDANAIFNVYPDPVLPPREIASADELVAWLGSPAAGLIPPREWSLPVRAAALIAVLAKLVRNKAWNKDVQGHQWVQEEDLLGQSPVMQPDNQRLYGEATELIGRGTRSLFLTKGGKQGMTPKEWCINTKFLPAVKRACVERSLDPLRAEVALRQLMEYVDKDDEPAVQVVGSILTERVLMECRART